MHHCVVIFNDSLYQFVPFHFRFFFQVLSNLARNHVRPLIALKVVCLHREQIYDTFKFIFKPDRDLHAHRFRGKALQNAGIRFFKRCARAVELVDVADAGHLGFLGISPVGF